MHGYPLKCAAGDTDDAIVLKECYIPSFKFILEFRIYAHFKIRIMYS